jgi:FkbH-like protein
MEFSSLKANLKKDFTGFKKIKIALLGDASLQFLAMAIRGYGYEQAYDIEVYEASYGQMASEILDLNSKLYEFNPEYIVLVNTSQHLLEKFYFLSDKEKEGFACEHVKQIKEFYHAILSKNAGCNILYSNFTEITESLFGNYANKLELSFEYQLRKLNFELMKLSHQLSNLHINDMCKLHAYHGRQKFFDARMDIVADLAFSLEILPAIAKNILDILNALLGNFKKCLILDLDNTLWGGIIGDDGLEGIEIGNYGIGKAYSCFQAWVKQLKNRGIILAICSQNEEEIAKLPFSKHPEMVLELNDISVFVANWESKLENIKYIQQILNIDFSSMVFIDDDPYQRNLIKSYLPEIAVPELPTDPAEYRDFIGGLNLFEVSNYSEEDKNRGQYYQEEIHRVQLKENFSNELAYLANLEMSADIFPFDSFTFPRVLQLIQRSNQFNLRTIRYSEEELQTILTMPKAFSMALSLKDKFGNYGIISVVILKENDQEQLMIDTWLMSCRVLKRGVEDLALACMAKLAADKGYTRLIGEYIPTSKNSLVSKHYQKMGFKQNINEWHLDLEDYSPQSCFIELKGWDNYAKSGFIASN